VAWASVGGVALQGGELAARLGDARRRRGESVLEGGESLAVVVGARQAGLGLFERLLGGALVCFGQLALGERFEAGTDVFGCGARRCLRGGAGRQQREQEQEKELDQRAHRGRDGVRESGWGTGKRRVLPESAGARAEV